MLAGVQMLHTLLGLMLLVSEHVAAGAGSMLLMDPEVPLKQCRYIRTFNMLQASCVDLKLTHIPSRLQSSIEVLDARENRIRELLNDSLAKYTSLRYLYLKDNFVMVVSERAFEPTSYLETLDLSKNAVTNLPKSLFELTLLRNLYLSDNQLGDDVFDVTDVRSPLEMIDLANNKLTRMPQLNPLASLKKLNVSKNKIERISADDIAPLCSLQLLDLTDNPVKFNATGCDCVEFRDWIRFRKISLLYKLDCPAQQEERCAPQQGIANHTLELYNGCLMSLRDRAEARKARTTWIWIATCIGAFMCCIFVALCCMHKRDRGKRRKLLKEKQMMHATSNPNTEQLLNKDPNHEQS